MKTRLEFSMQPQPDETTCGPTCLQAVYRYFDDTVDLPQVISETSALEGGGTLGVYLATHALRRGYRAAIYTYNLHMFDPTWFVPGADSLQDRLRAQLRAKGDPHGGSRRGDRKRREASQAYIEFLDQGGSIYFEDLTRGLIAQQLGRGVPILTGLSATYLYHAQREVECRPDDLRGDPVGHFVVLCGYDANEDTVLIADPAIPNPLARDHFYEIGVDRVLGAILLGIVTYDANLVLVEPAPAR